MGDISLILGGIKTGKTGYAQKKALSKEKQGGTILYLATAQALDSEMKERIERHKADRPKNWDTIEEPLKIAEIIEKEGNNYDFILLDCLTLWLTNRLIDAGEEYNRRDLIESILNEVDTIIDTAIGKKCVLAIISNQVETGLISPYPLGRIFQDITGLMHQKIAKKATNVVVMQAGIATAIKGSAE